MAEANQPSGSRHAAVAVTADELHERFGIAPEEAASFHDIACAYTAGDTIIREGDQERALYLLRVGTVDVLKHSAVGDDAMDAIDAVNFFGEMSMINDEPRSATIVARSERVVVYRIPNPNIHTILTNPVWAELLISRLARNLARCVEQKVALGNQVITLQAEVARCKAVHRA